MFHKKLISFPYVKIFHWLNLQDKDTPQHYTESLLGPDHYPPGTLTSHFCTPVLLDPGSWNTVHLLSEVGAFLFTLLALHGTTYIYLVAHPPISSSLATSQSSFKTNVPSFDILSTPPFNQVPLLQADNITGLAPAEYCCTAISSSAYLSVFSIL